MCIRDRAAVAGAAIVVEDRDLPIEVIDRAVHVRDLQEHARIVDEPGAPPGLAPVSF